MDLNYLFHRQQVERAKAESAGTEIVRDTHRELAAGYEQKIGSSSHGDFYRENDGSEGAEMPASD